MFFASNANVVLVNGSNQQNNGKGDEVFMIEYRCLSGRAKYGKCYEKIQNLCSCARTFTSICRRAFPFCEHKIGDR